MQDDSKTKSTDFLPGKPSMDSMSRSSNPAVASTTTSSNAKSLENASAHVIDLKNNPSNFADSPLLQQSSPDVKELPKTDTALPSTAKDTESANITNASQPIDESATHKPDGFSSIEVESSHGSSSSMSEPADSTQVPDATTTEPEKKLDELNLANSSVATPDKNIEKPKKSGKLKWILISIAIVLVVVIGAGVAVYVLQIMNSTT